jgi:hypothetical protein
MRKNKQRAAVLLATSVFAAGAGVLSGSTPAFATQAMPRTATNYYISSVSTTTAYNDGCSAGKRDALSPNQDSEVVLDFGGQNSAGTGTKLINGTMVSWSQIQGVAEQFGAGYYTCTGSDTTSVVHLGLGTNNSYYNVSSAGGQSWANNVVKPVISWVTTSGINRQVSPMAANDIEPSYSAVSSARAWEDGYASIDPALMLNYGSADGCPQTTYSNGSCNNGWHQADLYYVSWYSPPAVPTPQIYYSSQSSQWTMISLYGYTYGGHGQVIYQGPLTQNGYNSTFSPSAAWNSFWTALNSHTQTSQSFQFSNNILTE